MREESGACGSLPSAAQERRLAFAAEHLAPQVGACPLNRLRALHVGAARGDDVLLLVCAADEVLQVALGHVRRDGIAPLVGREQRTQLLGKNLLVEGILEILGPRELLVALALADRLLGANLERLALGRLVIRQEAVDRRGISVKKVAALG